MAIVKRVMIGTEDVCFYEFEGLVCPVCESPKVEGMRTHSVPYNEFNSCRQCGVTFQIDFDGGLMRVFGSNPNGTIFYWKPQELLPDSVLPLLDLDIVATPLVPRALWGKGLVAICEELELG